MTAARDKWREVRAMDVSVTLPLGPNTADRFLMDPKRLGFYAARYTFAAKMLHGCKSILDVGCGDGFFSTTLVHDTGANVTGIDFDPELITYANNVLAPAFRLARKDAPPTLDFWCTDFLSDELLERYDGAVSMDCIEHIEPDETGDFIKRMHQSLVRGGVAIIGTPNQHAEALGSPHSRTGHINLFTPARLRKAMQREFRNVFMFGMNDGTLNVGHENLWHYVIGVGCV